MLRSSEKREPLVEKYPHQLSLWASIGVLFLIDSVVGKFIEFVEKQSQKAGQQKSTFQFYLLMKLTWTPQLNVEPNSFLRALPNL